MYNPMSAEVKPSYFSGGFSADHIQYYFSESTKK